MLWMKKSVAPDQLTSADLDLHCFLNFEKVIYSGLLLYLTNAVVVSLQFHLNLKDLYSCPTEIIKGLTDKGQFQYLT